MNAQQKYLSTKQGLWGVTKMSKKFGFKPKELKSIEETEVYQITKPERHRDIKFNKIIGKPRQNGRDWNWQMDLMDWAGSSKRKKSLASMRFVLCYIDVYSRFAWCIGLNTKTTTEIMKVSEPLLRKHRPMNLSSDKESAVLSKKFRSLLSELDIKLWNQHSFLPGKTTHTAIVERFQKSLRNLMVKAEILQQDKRAGKFLADLVSNYNSSTHRSLRWKSPANVYKLQNSTENQETRNVPEFQKGDRVRVRLRLGTFTKRSAQLWSKTIYIVEDRIKNAYKLEDREGLLQARDLQLVKGSGQGIRRSARGRSVDNLPDGAQLFSLSPIKKPYTTVKRSAIFNRAASEASVRQSKRQKKRVNYAKFY